MGEWGNSCTNEWSASSPFTGYPMGGPQSQSGHGGRQTNICPCRKRSPCCLILQSILTEQLRIEIMTERWINFKTCGRLRYWLAVEKHYGSSSTTTNKKALQYIWSEGRFMHVSSLQENLIELHFNVILTYEYFCTWVIFKRLSRQNSIWLHYLPLSDELYVARPKEASVISLTINE
jgi:hypothetical protein